MKRRRNKDEYLEQLWYMQENMRDSLDDLKKALGENFNEGTFTELLNEGTVALSEADNRVAFTEEGKKDASRIIRAHRIAERLISDVLGDEFESGACEFEHTVNPEIVDSICTLLGHPRECPHGRIIPEGECCRRFDRTVNTAVVPITNLEVGQTARVAYVQCKDDQQLHRMDGLQIRPGVDVKLHQKYPTFVVECEGASIALGNDVASNICVWVKEGTTQVQLPPGPERWGFFPGFRHRRRGRGA